MRLPILAAVLAASLSCDGGRERNSAAHLSEAIVNEGEARLARQASSNALPAQAVAAAGDVVLFPRSAVATNMVRTAQASVEVDSLERAVALVRALAERVGGYVANTALQTGRGQLRSATLEVKIPADRFDEGLAGLAPIGKLESVNVSAEDVGEEFVMGEAFKQAWRNFVDLVAWFVRALGIIVPLGGLATAAWLGARRWHQGRAA